MNALKRDMNRELAKSATAFKTMELHSDIRLNQARMHLAESPIKVRAIQKQTAQKRDPEADARNIAAGEAQLKLLMKEVRSMPCRGSGDLPCFAASTTQECLKKPRSFYKTDRALNLEKSRDSFWRRYERASGELAPGWPVKESAQF